MPARKKVIAPAQKFEDPTQLTSEDFDPDEPDGLTDEDALAEANAMPDTRRRALESSRKRGRAPKQGHSGHKGNAARGSREHRDHDFTFRPLNSLDAPPPQAGMEQRWIRIVLNDKTDVRNWSKQSRYKWQPRRLETVPDNFNPPSAQLDKLGDVIMVGDLMLCERDARIGRSRAKYMADLHDRQMKATKRHVAKVEREGHPIEVEDTSEKPTVGRFRRIKAQADE